MWDPRVWGSIVGAVGGSVFVHANRGGLSGSWPLIALLAWAVAVTVYVVAVFVMRRHFPRPEPVQRSAGLVYLASCLGMFALIAIGGRALAAAEAEQALPAVIVIAVGLHFLPFARSFNAALFWRLGLTMTVLGLIGLILGLAWTPVAAMAIAVLTGLVMLIAIAHDAYLTRTA